VIEHRNPSIQGLRALAVILVVLFHSNALISGGFLGVDVFFVISGFVITGMAHREWKLTSNFDPITFLSRRAKRLLPSLFLLLLLILAYSTLFESWILEQSRTQTTILFSLFSFSNWRFAFEFQDYFSLSTNSNPLLHTWSLGVEEQYYLFFPIVVLLLIFSMRFKFFRKSSLISVAVLAFFASLYFQIHFSLINADEVTQLLPLRQMVHNIFHPFYGTVGRIWEFMFGSFGYYISQSEFKLRIPAVRLLNLMGLFVVVTTAFIADESVPAWSWANILVCSATTLMLITTDSRKGLDFLASRPMVWIGDRSYGWYLWHWPLIVGARKYFDLTILNSITASIIGLLIASFVYKRFENPIRVKNWSTKRIFRFLGIPFVILLSLIGLTKYVVTPYLTQVTASTYSEVVNGCRPNFELCVFPSHSDSQYLLLGGDSHGLSIATPILRIAEESGFGLIICTKQCQDANRIEDLARIYKITALISMNQFQSAAGTSSLNAIRFGRENPSIKLILVLDNPLFKDWTSPTILGPKTDSLRVQDVIKQQVQAREFLVDSTMQHKNMFVFDTLKHLCNNSICPVRDGRKSIYFDDNHLTEYGSMKLYPALKNAVFAKD
jgi:peptidoglycan/LPS O-acetylase OafA/YrhL